MHAPLAFPKCFFSTQLERGRFFLNKRIPYGKNDAYGSLTNVSHKYGKNEHDEDEEEEDGGVDNDVDDALNNGKNLKRKVSSNESREVDGDEDDENEEASEKSFDDVVNENLLFLPYIDVNKDDNKKDQSNVGKAGKDVGISGIDNEAMSDEINFKKEENLEENKAVEYGEMTAEEEDELLMGEEALKMFRRKQSIEEEKFKSLKYTDDGWWLGGLWMGLGWVVDGVWVGCGWGLSGL